MLQSRKIGENRDSRYFVVDALLRAGYGAGMPQVARIVRPGVARPGDNHCREAFPARRDRELGRRLQPLPVDRSRTQ